jgi:hypothetical protein
VATALALGVAAIVLVGVVFPAEYGIDWLGTGEAFGLTVLSGPASIPVRSEGLVAQPQGYRVDERTFELSPGEELEFKYRIGAGGSMVYSWTATGPVKSEMHSEADDAPEGTAEFFEIEESTDGRHGTYTAPFDGIHGWYWINEGAGPLTLRLFAAGFFTNATEYPSDAPAFVHQITRGPGDAAP